MKVILVRYKVKPDEVGANEAALAEVFAAIEQDQPEGVRYASFKLSDGVSFIALVQLADGVTPLNEKDYFKKFQAGVMMRVDGPPVQEEIAVVGSYNFWPE